MSLSNATLNVVCNMCSSALSTAKEQYDILMNMYRSCDGSEMIIHNKIAEKKIRQHSNSAELKKAADAGCHLCNLIKLFSRGVVGIKGDVPVFLKFDAVQALKLRNLRPHFEIVIGDEFTEIHLGVNKHSAVPWALRFQQGSLGIVICQGVFAKAFLPARFMARRFCG
jgi:hypothetical protein